MLKLYENIKQRRIALGMSQSELAERTGYADKSTISRIEAGKVDLSQSKIKLFADVLRTTPADLMMYESEEMELIPQQAAVAELVDLVEKCDEETVKRLTAYLKFLREYEK